MRRYTAILLSLIIWILMCECGAADSAFRYEVAEVHPVAGRQGICTEAGYYWVSGSGTLTKYDADWNLVVENTEPFDGYELEVNHIGDIDVYHNELYLGVEYFMDGEGKNIQVAVYDGDTLKLKRFSPFALIPARWNAAGSRLIPIPVQST